ncbi:MAG TPA: 5-(carboxyamino)imidazole ribonucleotide synthase [Steroidobacteraceae bacterium]|nr:5-(carboxyamino)imidazole ribonucleotide synthase [Steroidobacteraceae bacterium]
MHIGIIGAGQLGRMMAISGIPLGMRFTMYDRSAAVPGAAVAGIVTGEFDDLRRLRRFAGRVDLVTFDWENVPVASARAVAAIAPVRPAPRALAVGQDRVAEKRLFTRLGIPVVPWRPVDDRLDLARAIAALGVPGILKTRRLGYDGKGQARLQHAGDADSAWRRLQGQPLVYERLVEFTHEVSLIGARDRAGRSVFYPLAENLHADGILAMTRAPFPDPALQRRAERHLRRLMAALAYTGVLCVEFFVDRGGLIANEMAPRVHNSGHWTIEGAETSQFENHLRAIAGLPLGSTAARGHAVMVNLIGRMPARPGVAALSGVHLHDYGKSPRPGRKLGHLTFVGADRAGRDRMATRLLRLAGAGARPLRAMC